MALALGVALAASPASAQKAPAKKAPAAAGKEADAKKQSAWVKLCETAKMRKPQADKKKKPEIITKKICLTHHERLDAQSGIVMVSAAIRKVEGDTKERLLIMVPLGMALPAGVQAKIDDQKTPIKLRYTLCHAGGCTAETEATPAIIAQLKKGNRMIVAAVNATGRPFYAPVPLVGFSKTYGGKPIDNRAYSQARRRLMGEIRKRQIARLQAAKKAKAAGGTVAVPKAVVPK